MDFKGIRVLIVEGYARQCLPFIHSFKEHGCEVSVLCNSKLDLGYVSRYADHKILGICNPDNYEASERYICDLIKTGNFDLVVPMVDFSARILSKNKEELSRYSKIASNEADVFSMAQDKLTVMRICSENNIPCPKTITDVSSFDDIVLENIVYPVVVKPRNGCGAKGFHCINTENEFIDFAKKITLSDYVIQEYIPQTNSNLSVNLFIDNEGEVKTAFTYVSRRWFPLKGGTGTFNELVNRPDAVEIAKKLVRILNLRGMVGIDMIDDFRDQIPKVIEINPRVMACSKIGFDGGADLAKFILQKEFDKEVDEFNEYTVGICVRMLQTDLLWFISSPNRFSIKPSWFSIKNTTDQLFYIKDPLPWFSFSFSGLLRYKKEMRKRQ